MKQEILAGAYRDYLAVELRMSPNTVEAYSREASFFCRFLDENNLDAVNAGGEVLESFMSRRASDQQLSSRTLSRIISSLRSFFDFLVTAGYRKDNPVSLLDMPRISRHLPEVMNLEEIDRFLSEIDTSSSNGLRDRALFELIYSCGLRVSEAVELKIGQVFLTEGIIRVWGKGSKERLVPLGDEAEFWLKRYLSDARPAMLKRTRTDRVFLNNRGEGLSRKGMWKRFKEIAARAGVSAKIHTLRHSFATHLIRNGADLRSVQELLGHADIATTQIYTHLDTAYLEQNHKKYHPRSAE